MAYQKLHHIRDNAQKIDPFYATYYKDVTSTQSIAMDAITNNLAQHGNVIISTDGQSIGKGKGKRKWISVSDDLAMSVILHTSSLYNNNLQCNINEKNSSVTNSQHIFSQLSYVICLSIIDGITELIPGIDQHIRCKWPNDVLIEAGKVSGFLITSLHHSPFITIGIGVNICDKSMLDAEFSTKSSYLRRYNNTIQYNHLAESILSSIKKYHSIRINHGFSHIRELWLQKAILLNKQINITHAGQNHTGIFKGVADDGAMVFQQGTQSRLIYSAEIFQ